MGKGTEIMRQQAMRDVERVNRCLAGFSSEELEELKAEALRSLPESSREFMARTDPAKGHVLRVLMVKWLDDQAEKARRAV